MYIHDRLKKIRNNTNLKQELFAESLNMKRDAYTSVELGRTNTTQGLLLSLREVYNVNIDWLITGKGDMYVTEKHTTVSSEVIAITTPRTRVLHLPNVTAWAGDVVNIDEGLSEVEEWQAPALNLGKGTWYSFRVQGNSMEPTLRADDLLLCEPPLTALRDVEPGALYVVVYANGVRVKRLHREGKGVLLRSDNATYRDEAVAEGHFSALRVRYKITDVRGFF